MNNTEKSMMDWVKAVAALGAIIGIIAGGFNFAYNEWYKTPKLTYEILDSYPLSDDEQIIPIIIRNEGHEKATNVRITVYSGGDILNVQEKTPEELRLNTKNSTLIVELSRLVGNSQITFYLRIKTFSQKPINDILIVSDQGSGGIHKSTSSDYLSGVSIATTIMASLFLLFYWTRDREMKHFEEFLMRRNR